MDNSLQLKHLRLVVYINSIFALEIFFAPIMIAFYLNYIGLTFNQMSLFFSLILVLNIIFEIPSGAISDLIGRKKAFIYGKAIYLFAMLSLLLINDFQYLFITAFLFSIGASLSSGNLQTIIFKNLNYLNIEKEYFFKLTSKMTSINLIASGIAAIIGGYLGSINLTIPLIIDIILLSINIILISLILVELNTTYKKNKKNIKSTYRKFYKLMNLGIYLSFKSKDIISILIFSSVTFALLRMSFNFYQPMFEVININLELFGVILFLLNIIAAFSAYMFSKIKNINFNFHLITTILLICSIVFITYGYFTISLFIAFSIHQIIRGYAMSYSIYYLNNSIPIKNKSRTTIQSVQNFFNALLCAIFISISGYFESLYGMSTSINILTILSVILLFSSYIININKEKVK